MKKIISITIGIFVIILLIAVGIYLQKEENQSETDSSPNNQQTQQKSPTPPQEDNTSPNITITSPTKSQTVSLPITITGQARVFENMLAYRITDSNGSIVSQGNAYADAPDVGQFGPYSISVQSLPVSTTNDLSITVFSHSPKDGSEINRVSIPVTLNKQNTQTIQLFFGKTNSAECENVVPVQRLIAKTQSPARTALDELLKGPAKSESTQGYVTSVNADANTQKLTITDGVAKADFNEHLNEGVAGSCRVMAIRSQITQTLNQFPTVKQVIISVNGRTEDILQP